MCAFISASCIPLFQLKDLALSQRVPVHTTDGMILTVLHMGFDRRRELPRLFLLYPISGSGLIAVDRLPVLVRGIPIQRGWVTPLPESGRSLMIPRLINKSPRSRSSEAHSPGDITPGMRRRSARGCSSRCEGKMQKSRLTNR